MSDAPERLYCWNFQPSDGGGASGWAKGFGGYARQTDFYPMNRHEHISGAIYVRADLVKEMKELKEIEALRKPVTASEADAPERVYKINDDGAVEYVRADCVEKLEAELAALRAFKEMKETKE